MLSENTITFGKYKNKTIDIVLKDRSYCAWLLKQEWFQNNYEFLFNRVKEYNPKTYFLNSYSSESSDFIIKYQYFNLIPIDEIKLDLTEDEKKCYSFYLKTVNELKEKIINRLDTDNPFNIKAPSGWLKKFENENGIKRDIFKIFLFTYDLPNIPYIVEDIKREGGIEYKGAQSFNISKKRSESQEAWWECILKKKYGEDIGVQFKHEKCIFDFLNISTNTIFECKLSLKDFNEDQHRKYILTLEKFRIIYLIGYECVINIEKKEIYTTDKNKYETYQIMIPTMKNPSKFDELIQKFKVIEVSDLSTLFGEFKNEFKTL